MENVITKFRKEDTHSFKKKAEKFKEKTGLKLEPDDLLPELVNEDSKEGKVELQGADKELRFIKINEKWEKYRVFHEFTLGDFEIFLEEIVKLSRPADPPPTRET